MNNRTELLKNTIILGIGQFIPSVVSIAFLPLLTKYLSAEDYGMYDLALTLVSLVIPCVSLQIQQASFRFLLKADDESTKGKYITNTFVILLMTSMAYPIIAMILNKFYFTLTDSILISSLLFGESVYRITSLVVRGLGKNGKYSASVTIYSIIYVILVFPFLIAFHWGLQGILLANILSHFITSIFLILSISIGKYLRIRYVSKSVIIEMLKYSIPIVPSSISIWIVNFSDRIVITSFLGVGMNGIYSVANKIPNIYAKLYGIFNLAWMENASKAYDDGDKGEYYSSLFSQMMKILVGIVLLLMACSYPVYQLLVDSKYIGGFGQIAILYIGILMNSFTSFWGSIFIAVKKTKLVGLTSILGAMLNIIINLLFVRKIGLYAASISTVISYLAILIYRMIMIKKHVHINYKFGEITITLLVLCLCAFISSIYSIWGCVVTGIIAFLYNFLFNQYLCIMMLNQGKMFFNRRR